MVTFTNYQRSTLQNIRPFSRFLFTFVVMLSAIAWIASDQSLVMGQTDVSAIGFDFGEQNVAVIDTIVETATLVDFSISISDSGDAVVLTWQSPTTPPNYQLSKSTTPYFNHSDSGVSDISGTCVDDNGAVTCTDNGAVGDVATNYYYLLTIYDESDQVLEELQVAEYDLPLVPPEKQLVDSDITVNHESIDQFGTIPDSYIEVASNTTMLFRHASVGDYISDGLDCLWNYFPDQENPNERPAGCDAGIDPSEVVYDPKYNRSNWVLEFHQPPPNQNPGWWNKETLFIDRVDNLGPDEQYEVVGFKFGDVDQDPNHDISVLFFDTSPDNTYPNTSDLEELDARHPDKILMWWSQPLNEHEQPIAKRFNENMRQYAADNHKVFLDIADIESHLPDGTPCLDAETGNTPATCPDYTFDGNHPNALGKQRLAKAVWVLMARIAGWDGSSP